MAVAGSLIIDTRIETGKLKTQLSDLEKLLDKTGASRLKGLETLGKVTLAGLTASFATLSVGIVGATKVGSDFEVGMSKVGATLGLTSEQIRSGNKDFAALAESAREMGRNTQFSATQASEALNFMALAGYDATTSIQTLPDVLNLASAGNLELGRASDILTDSLSALNLNSDYASTLIDQMAKTSSKSNTNINQLGEAILTVGSTAKNLAGGTIELTTALGVLADSGIKASESGTHLRNILVSLQNPTKEASQQLEALGINAYDSEGNLRPLNETLGDLNKALANATQSEYDNIVNKIFRTTDLAAVGTLLDSTTGRFDELMNSIADSESTAREMAKVLNDNLAGSLKVLKSGLSDIGITVYQSLQEPFKKAINISIESVEKLAKSLTNGDLQPSLDKLAENFGKLISLGLDLAVNLLPKLITGFNFLIDNFNILAPLIGISVIALQAYKLNLFLVTKETSLMAIATNVLSISVTALKVAMGFLLSPIGLLVAGLTALTIGFIAYKKSVEESRQEMLNAGKSIDELNNKLESIGEKTQNTQKLIDEFRELKEKINDTTLSVEALENAQNRLVEVENQLISASDGFLTVNALQNENLEENIQKLERKLEIEQQMAEIELKRVVAEVDIDKLNKEVELLENRRDVLTRTYNEQTNKLVELKSIQAEYNLAINDENLLQREKNQIIRDLSEQSSILTGRQIDLFGSTIAFQSELEKTERQLNKLSNELKTNTTELSAGIDTTVKYNLAIDSLNSSLDTENDNIAELTDKIIDLEVEQEKLNERNEYYNKSIQNTENEINKLISSYTSLAKGEQLSASNILELQEYYPDLIDLIDLTGEANEKNAEIFEATATAKKESLLKELQLDKENTENAIIQANERLAIAKEEFDKKAELFKSYAQIAGETSLFEETTGAELIALDNKLKAIDDKIKAVEAIDTKIKRTVVPTDGGGTSRGKSIAVKQAEDENAELEKLEQEKNKALEEQQREHQRKTKELIKQREEQRLSIIKNANYDEITILTDNGSLKTKIFTDDYLQEISLIDELSAIKLKSHNDEIKLILEKLDITDSALANEIRQRTERMQQIDEEIQAERELLRIEQQKERLATLESKVRTAETTEDKIRAEKELFDYRENLQREEFERNLNLEKQALAEEISNLKQRQKVEIELAEQTIAEKQQLQQQALKDLENQPFEVTNQVVITTETTEIGITKEEEIDEIIDNMAEIAEKKEDKWENIGSLFGNALINGLENLLPYFDDLINKAMDKLEHLKSLYNDINSQSSFDNTSSSNINYSNVDNLQNAFLTPQNFMLPQINMPNMGSNRINNDSRITMGDTIVNIYKNDNFNKISTEVNKQLQNIRNVQSVSRGDLNR